MRRSVRTLLVSSLIAASSFAQTPTDLSHRVRPAAAVPVQLQGTLDLRDGSFQVSRAPAIDLGASARVYDNTCGGGGYLGLLPAGPGGTGSAFAETLGDFGAIQADTYLPAPGDASCLTGCAQSYDITEFEISWCQLTAPPTGTRIELQFWDPPHASCVLGTAPGNNPTGGLRPPATSALLSTTLTGLPRSATPGVLACYVLNVTLATPGFSLHGSSSFETGVTAGDKFAWGFTLPTSTGADGPVLAGDLGPTSPCAPCQFTIFEAGPASTVAAGTGAGQDGTFFLESYGGSRVPPSNDCVTLGATGTPSGMYLALGAYEPCVVCLSCFTIEFCNFPDLQACPCAPGASETGCDVPIPGMQGGGLTGGVRLEPIAQQTSPTNRATLRATGFPSASSPSGAVFRNTALDPGSPIVFGDGLRCVDAASSPGTLARIGASIASNGVMTNTFGHGTMIGTGTFFYQLWFRSNPASYCNPSAAFNLSNGVTLNW